MFAKTISVKLKGKADYLLAKAQTNTQNKTKFSALKYCRTIS